MGVVLRHATEAVLIAFAILMLVALGKFVAPSGGAAGKVFRVLLDALSTILLIPFQIIAYRLIILGELPARYLAYFSMHFRAYFTWVMIFWLPTIVGEVLPENVASLFVWSTFLTIAAIVAAIRLVVLFPALATSNDHVTLADAWRDTRGRVWSIIRMLLPLVIILIGITMAVMAAIMLLSMTTGVTGLSSWKLVVVDLVTGAVAIVAILAVSANTALIFNAIGDRVKRGLPANPS